MNLVLKFVAFTNKNEIGCIFLVSMFYNYFQEHSVKARTPSISTILFYTEYKNDQPINKDLSLGNLLFEKCLTP